MGLTKSEIFTDKQNKLAGMMKALAHPARIAIIQHLIRTNACICGDLVDEFLPSERMALGHGVPAP